MTCVGPDVDLDIVLSVQTVQRDKELCYNKSINQSRFHIEVIKAVVNSDRVATAAHLQRSGHISVNGLTEALLWFRVHAFPALPQDHINLHINQQSDDEGNIEGHDGRVYHKGWIGDHTERLITSSCGERHRVNKGFGLHVMLHSKSFLFAVFVNVTLGKLSTIKWGI